MTIFDYLNDILKDKTGTLPLEGYSPYLVNRWVSFINPHLTEFVNQFNTKLLLEDKELHYKTMLSALPRINRVPRINYIKKLKEEKTEKDSRIKIIANNLEISEREAELLLNETVSA